MQCQNKRQSVVLDLVLWLQEFEDVERGSGKLFAQFSVSEQKYKTMKLEFRANEILYGCIKPYLNKELVADIPVI